MPLELQNKQAITTRSHPAHQEDIQNGRDITNVIENQEPFNFDSTTPKLKILTTVKTMDTSPEEKLEIKHENDQYRIQYEAESN